MILNVSDKVAFWAVLQLCGQLESPWFSPMAGYIQYRLDKPTTRAIFL